MSLILHIETTSDVCSVALSNHGKLVNLKEDKEGRSHASKLAVLIDELMKQEGLDMKQLQAVSISQGPGSYTGLRIGVSTAKGLCYGLGIPLIAVHTLQSLTQGLIENASQLLEGGLNENDKLVPMIDARRMEVYTAVLDKNNNFLTEVKPMILDENVFTELLDESRVIFFGSGSDKSRDVIKHANALFISEVDFSAKYMIPLAEEQFREKDFVDVAYFEPFYLKAFQATTPKNKLF
jgi:tRNA threonylcarbamoyladenosine biosynthesis protein TsaB